MLLAPPVLLAAHTVVLRPTGLTSYDYGVIAFYVLLMLAIGLLFRRLSRNTSDYFRCGGAMPWWITGTSAWLAIFSGWTFVGAASEVYRSGLTVLLLYYATIPAQVCVLLYSAVRFRRMRVVTWMEAVRQRFGPGTEQFYTWIKVPIELLKASIGLMSICVFMAAVFNVPVNYVVVALGTVITLVACVGGAFAVLASDFVQMLLVMTIALIVAFLTVRQPEIGGLTGLVKQVDAAHPAHFRWALAWRPVILFGWALAFTWVKVAELNSMESSTMYLMSKSERHARRMVLIPLIGGLVGPLLWIVPPLAATVMFPDLGALFPQLAKPSEAAYVAAAMRVMPVGLLGLLTCAMFGATLTNMDAAVNKYVGVFIRSFYLPRLKPQSSERDLLLASKICTLCFGAIIIALAVLVNTYRKSDVFTLLNQAMVSLGLPLTLPVFFGLHFRRTPGWAAWVTALACFAFSAWANFEFAQQLERPDVLASLPAWAQDMIGHGQLPLTGPERSDLLLVVTAFGTSFVGIFTFFGSALFYRMADERSRQSSTEFFRKLDTPLPASGDAAYNDEPVYRLLGTLCMVYGVFILLLTLIPNGFLGRLCFVFVGVVIGGAGAVLFAVAQTKRRLATAASLMHKKHHDRTVFH